MHATSRLGLSGVLYVALGANARAEATKSRNTLPKGLPSLLLKEVKKDSLLTVVQQAHLMKTRACHLSPYRYTLLLDADTRVKGDISLGFKLLQSGFDVVMIPSWPTREGQTLWSLSGRDRKYTFETLGTFRHVMLNTGVIFFSKNERVKKLFKEWEAEWLRFKERDQGAFLRALQQSPVSMFLLGKAFNSVGGEVIEHRFGKAI